MKKIVPIVCLVSILIIAGCEKSHSNFDGKVCSIATENAGQYTNVKIIKFENDGVLIHGIQDKIWIPMNRVKYIRIKANQETKTTKIEY